MGMCPSENIFQYVHPFRCTYYSLTNNLFGCGTHICTKHPSQNPASNPYFVLFLFSYLIQSCLFFTLFHLFLDSQSLLQCKGYDFLWRIFHPPELMCHTLLVFYVHCNQLIWGSGHRRTYCIAGIMNDGCVQKTVKQIGTELWHNQMKKTL